MFTFIKDFIKYIILGLIQGFTEPIPVSSSGHLVIFKNLFKIDALNDLNFEIIVNFGSLIAIVILFRSELIKIFKETYLYIKTKKEKYKINFKYFLCVAIGTIPAGVIGLLFKHKIEAISATPKVVGFTLLITALFLFSIRKFKGEKSKEEITFKDAIIVGLFQAVALLPGISRSGATLVGGMFCNLKREEAFKFSFMLYIPISLATLLSGTSDLISSHPGIKLWFFYIVGLLVSLIATLFSTKWFHKIVKQGKLMYFVTYCLIVGVLVVLFM